jgi:hypothetical protein
VGSQEGEEVDDNEVDFDINKYVQGEYWRGEMKNAE